MERLQERIKMARRALSTLEEIMKIHPPSNIERDAAIQRFEFTFEAIWKAAKQMLFDIEGMDIGSPKGVIRACREIAIFSDEETIQALQMVNDRNLTVHTYNEELAEEIYSRLSLYLNLLSKWVVEIEKRMILSNI